ncbi:hypothetical protein DFH09DRAFT_405122 [Mycena vulgaris]|nr:hypothetical protein DFH09DRAFT_405122 [Mycena vulgaris]
MSFFSGASGVNILGGTFYSSARDVNIQNNTQFAIEEDAPHALLAGPSAHGEEGTPQDRSLSGPERHGPYSTRTDRFLPYDISARPDHSLRQSLPPIQNATPHGIQSAQSPFSQRNLALPPLRDVVPHLYRPILPPPPGTGAILWPQGAIQGEPLEHTGGFPHIFPPILPHGQMRGNYHAIDAPPSSAGDSSSHSIRLDAAPSSITPLTSSIYPAALPHEAVTNIHGGSFVGGNVNNIVRNGESGIGILNRAVAIAALHDAAESYPQPRCHPETRHELLEDLWTWCTDSNGGPSILWLHGPAGAGKSAVMKSLSETLQSSERLGATFFFKRGHPTRGNAHVLFATIALQLAINIPALNLPISRAVEADPMLVGRSTDVQLRELIVDPCSRIECGLPWTIVIDGLDECDGKHIQQEILRLIGTSFAQARLPFQIIIASRPEPHIREVFEGSLFDLHRPVNIEQSFVDVRAYLESEFARIHREHSTMAAVPNPWPSAELIDHLVEQSSGYFIYASTVIKFIDDKNYRPTRRLAALEDTPATHPHSPFAALDALYTQILSEIADNSNLVPILRVSHYFWLQRRQIDELLGLESGDVDLALRGLHSVMEKDNPFLVFEHASFNDFLNDPLRAGDFYIGDTVGLENLARRVLSELGYMYEDRVKNRDPMAFEFGSRLIDLMNQVAPSEDLVHLVRAINPDFINYHRHLVRAFKPGFFLYPRPAVHALLSWAQVSISLSPTMDFTCFIAS